MTGHLLDFSNNKLLLTRRPFASNRYISCEACGWLVLTTCREDMISDRAWEAGGEQHPDEVSAGAVLCWYRVKTVGSWYQDTDYVRWHAPRWPWSCLPLRCANSKYDSATARCIDNRATAQCRLQNVQCLPWKDKKKIVSIQSRVPLRCLQRPAIFFFFQVTF